MRSIAEIAERYMIDGKAIFTQEQLEKLIVIERENALIQACTKVLSINCDDKDGHAVIAEARGHLRKLIADCKQPTLF